MRRADAQWNRSWHYWRWSGPVLIVAALVFALATSTNVTGPVGVAAVLIFGPVILFDLAGLWRRVRRRS